MPVNKSINTLACTVILPDRLDRDKIISYSIHQISMIVKIFCEKLCFLVKELTKLL